VPLLAFGPEVRPVPLGTRATLSDTGKTVAANFNCDLAKGTSFLTEIL
jgi:phosphopentomutase